VTLKFRQEPLPPGVYHVIVDDGQDVTHVFSDCAPWRVVQKAAEQGSTEYAARYWQRRECQSLSRLVDAKRGLPRWLRRLAGQPQDDRKR